MSSQQFSLSYMIENARGRHFRRAVWPEGLTWTCIYTPGGGQGHSFFQQHFEGVGTRNCAANPEDVINFDWQFSEVLCGA